MYKRIIIYIIIAVVFVFAQDDDLMRAKKELEEHKARVAKLEELARVKKEIEETKAHAARLEAQISKPENEPSADEIINVYISVENPPSIESEPSAPAFAQTQEQKSDGKYFVFSLRPELFTSRGATAVGGGIELGNVGESGFYFSTSFNGGTGYFGGGFSFGGTANKDGNVKNVLGVTAGFWSAPSRGYADIYNNGFYQYREYYKNYNYSFGGLFWKLLFGEENHFDVTNKLLFGNRGKHKPSNSWGGDWLYSSRVRRGNVTYSLSVGYTLIKKRGK